MYLKKIQIRPATQPRSDQIGPASKRASDQASELIDKIPTLCTQHHHTYHQSMSCFLHAVLAYLMVMLTSSGVLQ